MAGEVLSGPFLHKRGTTAKVATYSGPAGEIVVDLGKSTAVVQNGSAGGVPLAIEARQIIAGAGVKVNDTTSGTLASDVTISVDTANLIAVSDGLLKTDANGKIATDLSMTYNAATGVVNIVGQDGTTVVATTTIPSSVSALKSVTLETDPTGKPAGTYLHFVYTLSTGTDTDLWVDVTTLVDVYTAADASVTVNGYTIKVNLSATDSGLQLKNDGLAVKLSADTGNQVALGTDGGLFVPASAVVTVVSADTGNIITEGTDEGALLKLASSNNAAMLDANGALIVPLDCGVIE